jgi:hypothetical protein
MTYRVDNLEFSDLLAAIRFSEMRDENTLVEYLKSDGEWEVLHNLYY